MKLHPQLLPCRYLVPLVLLLALASMPLAAAPADESPRFQIELITVEGAKKISPEIVVAESLLETGQAYSESELRDARYRIVRLPFVLDAEFSLRRGTRRGLYELVIEVEDTRRWFFGVDLEVTRWAEPISFQDLSTEDYSLASAGLSGRRFAVGRHGVFFVALGGEDGSLQFGYNQYGLFDRNILLGVGLSLSDCSPEEDADEERSSSCRTDLYELGLDPTFSSWSVDDDSASLRFDLGLPLRGNQSVRLTHLGRDADAGFRRQAYTPQSFGFYNFTDLEERRTNLSWVFNSIDEPLFPTEGQILEAGLSFNRLRADLQSITRQGPLPDIRAAMESRELGLQFRGNRYWPVSGSQSLSAKLDLFVGRSDINNVPTESRALLNDNLDVVRGSFVAGHAKFLKRTRTGSRWRDLRWESDVEFRYEGTSPTLGLPDNPLVGFRLGTGLSFRNTWTVIRFKVSYLDLEGR